MANAFLLYKALAEEHNPNSKPLDMKQAIKEAIYTFCQQGKSMRKQNAEHPAWIRDVSVVHSAETGRKIRTDENGVVSKLNEQAELERVNLIYRFSRENLLGKYTKVLLETFVSIVYLNAAQAYSIVV